MDYDVFQVLITVLIGAAGGFARQLHFKEDSGGANAVNFISGCFIAAFTGAVIYFLTTSLGWDANLACALSGISGWLGPRAMDLITEMAGKKMGIDLKNGGGKKNAEDDEKKG